MTISQNDIGWSLSHYIMIIQSNEGYGIQTHYQTPLVDRVLGWEFPWLSSVHQELLLGVVGPPGSGEAHIVSRGPNGNLCLLNYNIFMKLN